MKKLNVAVIFGSRSVEHDVSIITGIQIILNLSKEKYNVIPIYITQNGNFLTGEYLKNIDNFKDKKLIEKKTKKVDFNNIDVAIIAVHGTNGEDGTLQGILEIKNIAYTCAGVVGSAVGMDKIIQKAAFRDNNIPVVDYVWFDRSNISIIEIEKKLKYPMFVKPANLGSSIGITKATDRKSLEFAIEVAFNYDRRILIEEAVSDATEINCSVLGNDNPIPSVLEEPVRYDEILSFKDKYLRGGKGGKGMASLTRKIPAPISKDLTENIKNLAVKAFKAVDCSGLARIDFLLNKKTNKVYVNEINTIPGSLAFYLWEKSGYPYPMLLDRLITLALERFQQKQDKIYSYDTNILNQAKFGTCK